MQIFLNTNYDFMGKRFIAYKISAVGTFLGFLGILFGLNYGIDFTGGTMIELKFNQPVQIDVVRTGLAEIGMDTAEIQSAGENGIFIRVPEVGQENAGDAIKNEMIKKFGANSFELLREDNVGPKIGKELRWTTVKAIFASLILMIIYIWFRFELVFGVTAVIALFHDVLFTLGLLWIFHFEISLTVIAALMTLVGFSINDTIVVFDRIRENQRLMRRANLSEIINASINQTLSRTIITSLTVFLVVFLLFIFGGDVLRGFSFAMTFGIITGTYSSIFVATPLVVDWDLYRSKKEHERLQTTRPNVQKSKKRVIDQPKTVA